MRSKSLNFHSPTVNNCVHLYFLSIFFLVVFCFLLYEDIVELQRNRYGS